MRVAVLRNHFIIVSIASTVYYYCYFYYYYCITFTVQRNLTNTLLLILLSSSLFVDILPTVVRRDYSALENVRVVVLYSFIPRQSTHTQCGGL